LTFFAQKSQTLFAVPNIHYDRLHVFYRGNYIISITALSKFISQKEKRKFYIYENKLIKKSSNSA